MVCAGDGKSRGRRSLLSATGPEDDRKLLRKVSHPHYRLRLRRRFLSEHHNNRRRRRSGQCRSYQNKPNIEECYSHPAKMLQTCGRWDFDVFHFDVLTGGRPLLYLGYHIFQKLGFLDAFRLDVVKLLRFISKIEDNYHANNPYHNALHAADVTQAMYCFLREIKVAQCLNSFEQMVAILSAMAHDVDHPGLNQSFLKATANVLIYLYRDGSVLEHHHWHFGLALMHETGLFAHLKKDQWSLLISLFQSVILATDISLQPKYVNEFKQTLDDISSKRKTLRDSRHFILKIAMKCSDVCNPCRKWDVSEKWSRKVCEEFFNQAALERERGLPVNPFFDPQVKTVAEIQIGFMSGIVLPLVEQWNRFLQTRLSKQMMDNVHANRQRWEAIRAKELQEEPGTRAGPGTASSSKWHAVTLHAQSSSCKSGTSCESVSSCTPSGKGKGEGKNRSRNNIACSVEEVIWLIGGEEEDEDEGEMVGDRIRESGYLELEEEEVENEEEEEENGEEADTVENNVNLAFHYQTDREQAGEGGHHSRPPLNQEEQIKILALSARRHSLPVAVRKDLGYFPGTRKDSCTCYNFLRRQSLPAPTVKSSWSDSRPDSGGVSHKDVSGEGMVGCPKIPNPVIDPHLPSFSFLPLQTQTQRLQQCAVEDNKTRTFSPAQPSASCSEFRRRSQVSGEDTERLKTTISRMVTGVRTCHRELVGLANSWPSIRRGPEKSDDDEIKLLADQLELPSPESSPDTSLSSSRSNSSGSIQVSLSPPPSLRLLSRRH
ncbi:hypothetical protein ACOMHN_051321 [Nucella lapillus]